MHYSSLYSEKEQKLISALKYEDVAKSPTMMPGLLYPLMAVECFRQNRQDKVAESVRNCLLALEKFSKNGQTQILRLTPEFDALITI